ncbi:MAG: hypothetical protein WD512_07570, partial [Candidatus Paceibacterota bacterium]
MASIILGTIITDLAGSVGGSTFRRTPRGIILYNKQGTQIKSAFAKNSVKNQIGVVFRAWQSLDLETRGAWSDEATLYPQLDKFGNTVTLTGRQFFTKLNTQLIPVQLTADINNISNIITDGLVVSVIASITAEQFIIDFNKEINDYFILVSVYPLRAGSGVNGTRHFFRTAIVDLDNALEVDIYVQFIAQFPFSQVGDY